MRRRKFLGVLGGAAAASWPVASRAQQRSTVRYIGVFLGPDDPGTAEILRPLRSSMQDCRAAGLQRREGRPTRLQVSLWLKFLCGSKPSYSLPLSWTGVRLSMSRGF